MKVNVVETRTTTYFFTKEERDYLVNMGIWGYINARLLSCERIEVE